MFKNVSKNISLLLIAVVLVMSSCSSSRKYSHKSTKRSKIERSRTTAKASTKSKRNKKTSSKRTKIVSTAKKYIGKTYTYGGKKPSTGFDCSGFTAHVFNNNGINLSGPSYSQARQGKRKKKNELQKGDLVFFGSNNKVSHVAIVTDVFQNKIKVIHSTSSRGVVIDDISTSDYWRKRYLFGRDVMN